VIHAIRKKFREFDEVVGPSDRFGQEKRKKFLFSPCAESPDRLVCIHDERDAEDDEELPQESPGSLGV
jgi:hypothetical protein